MLEARVVWLSVVDSEDSGVSVVLVQVGRAAVLTAKMVPAMLVVSTCTGVLSDTEFAAEEW